MKKLTMPLMAVMFMFVFAMAPTQVNAEESRIAEKLETMKEQGRVDDGSTKTLFSFGDIGKSIKHAADKVKDKVKHTVKGVEEDAEGVVGAGAMMLMGGGQQQMTPQQQQQMQMQQQQQYGR